MTPHVSVIVAVYNAEKTLSRCLDSLIGQDFQEIEILLVDDGSTDSSGSICDRYAAADSRIRVFHKANEGVSRTRQFGLGKAIGEYIIFLDSDDYVAPDIYRKLYHKAAEDHADIVCCDFYRITSGGTRIEKHNIPSFKHEVFLEGVIDKLFGSLWNRLIRRSLYEDYAIVFNADLSFGEDKLALLEILNRALADNHHLIISYVPEPLVYYDTAINPSSLTKMGAKKKLEARLKLWNAMGKTLNVALFGKTYYWLLTKHGFGAFWNHVLTQEEFEHHFSDKKEGIRIFAPESGYKWLVLMACSGKWALAQKMRWLAYGRILYEKILISLNIER